MMDTTILVLLFVALCACLLLLKRVQVGFDPHAIKDELGRLEDRLRSEFATGRREAGEGRKDLRQEMIVVVQESGRTLQELITNFGGVQQQQFTDFSERLDSFRDSLIQAAQSQREELARGQQVFTEAIDKKVAELRTQVGELTKVNEKKLGELGQTYGQELETIRATLDTGLEMVRKVVGEQFEKVRQENGIKLEEMRRTVDEKLHDTLEKRLGESFLQVSERLEQVHKGLGEMQLLATGVGDLKKMLTNVKTRGAWGEMQLGNLLEEMLTPEQYEVRARPKPHSTEMVDFAIQLPGPEDGERPVLLPIDAKFPKEDYERLVDASEKGDSTAVDAAVKRLEARIRHEARDIRDKYIEPPHTTDFAILYLPIEGLYAEVLRRPGLADSLQRDCRVMIAGPTTLAALLNSLQMGFRTLAIQKRSSEVWKVLGAVKKKFESFGITFTKVQKKIQEAEKALEAAKEDTRIIGKKLRTVDTLPAAEAQRVLSLPSNSRDPSDDGETAA